MSEQEILQILNCPSPYFIGDDEYDYSLDEDVIELEPEWTFYL